MTSCADCPDLEFSPDRPKGALRSICCRDEHLNRRRAGSSEELDDLKSVRARVDLAAKRAEGNRKTRRANRAKARA